MIFEKKGQSYLIISIINLFLFKAKAQEILSSI